MKVETLKKIEGVLDELRSCDSDDCDDVMDELLLSICEVLNLSPIPSPSSSLFGKRRNSREKDFVSACFLRALSRNPDVFWGPKKVRIRERICSLFDHSLIEIYKDLNISSNDKFDEKLSKLQDLERGLLDDFLGLHSSVKSIEDCRMIKSKFMPLFFGNRRNHFIVSRFSGNVPIRKDDFKSLFQVLEDYLSSSTVESVAESYKAVKGSYKSYIKEIKEKSSKLFYDCIGQLFEKILSIVQKDFDAKDALVSTEVEVEVSDKKYPFHVAEQEINIVVFAKNKGEGKALDVEVSINEHDDDSLMLVNPIIKLGSLDPGEIREFYFEAVTRKSLQKTEPEIVFGVVSWRNYNGENNARIFEGELLPQDPHLDWEEMSKKKPYILEAVTEEKKLVGRNELLKQLTPKLISDQLESSIIYGQKRVGKTSIAKTVQNKLKDLQDYTAIYLLVGSLDKSTPEKCLNCLGEFIFDEIYYDSAFKDLKLPDLKFEGSITPLDRFFRVLRRLKPEHKFVIIIDEFDEIPSELYQINSIGDNFFHNIRSLSSENNISFVLVGGENMKIIKQSTDKLNKFESFSVDYFDNERYWNDFQDLVRRPTAGKVEFTDDAVIALYNATEGNPFFTKLICGNIYRRACETRNSYVSEEEVNTAITSCLKSLDTNNVNHFWKDGITQTEPAEIDQLETRRRKFLISYADVVRSGKKATKEKITNTDMINQALAGKLLESFSSRKILIESDSTYRCKPRFFNNWLIGPGFQTITSESLDEQAIELLQQRESQAFVEDTEIIKLCDKWGHYRGTPITPSHIRAWLNQFGSNIEKRLMFTLLQNIRFYGQSLILEKLKVISDHVRRGLFKEIKQVNTGYEKSDRTILTSYFGELANSGPTYIRMYAHANNLYRGSKNTVGIDKIGKTIKENERIQAIVFIDDIIASGGTVVEGLKKLNDLCGDFLAARKVKVVPAAICGFEDGLESIKSEVEKLPFNVEPFVCDLLTEADKCFSSGRKIFTEESDLVKARQIAHDYGHRLVKNMPLGYKNNQLLVTFYETCPNNSLPILWADQVNWKALFSRK
ncbi:MAG: ATP-binding protein [Cyanobacteria bacterium P01_G01_bin.54]